MSELTWMPHIDSHLCNGCGACIDACPTQALACQDGKAALTRPDLCIYCATCETICPTQAIELPYLIVRAPIKKGHPYES